MRWVEHVHCTSCKGTTEWIVEDGVWTCHFCGHVMTVTEIAAYHASLT